MNAPLIQIMEPRLRVMTHPVRWPARTFIDDDRRMPFRRVAWLPRPRRMVSREAAQRAQRPVTRADCVGGQRPCPWVSCREHLGQVQPAVMRSKHRPWLTDADVLDVADMGETCTLDVTDRNGVTLDVIGDAIGVTREYVRQIEARLLARLGLRRTVRELAGEPPTGATLNEQRSDRPDADVLRDLCAAPLTIAEIAEQMPFGWNADRVRYHAQQMGLRAPKRAKSLDLVANFMRSQPGWVTTDELTAALKPSRKTLLSRLKTLKAAGKVESESAGRPRSPLQHHRWVR